MKTLTVIFILLVISTVSTMTRSYAKGGPDLNERQAELNEAFAAAREEKATDKPRKPSFLERLFGEPDTQPATQADAPK